MKSSLANPIYFYPLQYTSACRNRHRDEHEPDRCPALAPMTADLNAAPFPADWTVYVACDVGTWEE